MTRLSVRITNRLVTILLVVAALIHLPADGISQNKETELFLPLGHASAVNNVAFTPDGKYLVSGGGGSIIIWEVATGQELRKIKTEKPVTLVRLSKDGNYFAAAYETESDNATIDIWDQKSYTKIHSLKSGLEAIEDMAFTSGNQLRAADNRTFKEWNIESGKELRSIEKGVPFRPIFSNDADFLFGSQFSATSPVVWDARLGKQTQSLSTKRRHRHKAASIDHLAASNNGKKLLSVATHTKITRP